MAAPTPAERQRLLAGLSTLTKRDLAAIWAKLNLAKPDRLAEPLAQVLAEIADKYGAAAASLAADWYDEARADAAVTGRFAAVLAAPPDTDRVTALARWGVGPLFGANPDGAAALSLIVGGLQRIVVDQARDTTFGSVAADPARPRWARHASANACAFCALMASRGAVYATERDASQVTGANLGGKDYRKMRRLGTSRESILAGVRPATVAAGGRKGRPTKRPLGEKYHDDCHCVAIEVFGEYTPAPYVTTKFGGAYDEAVAKVGSADVHAVLAEMRQSLGVN